MSQEVIILTLIALFILILAILTIAVLKFKSRSVQKNIQTKKQELTLQDLINAAKDKNSSKEELFKILRTFATSFKIPSKVGGKTLTEARTYLTLITILSSHPKTDAKFIAFMNSELKKANPDYANEIDVYEKIGVNKRA